LAGGAALGGAALGGAALGRASTGGAAKRADLRSAALGGTALGATLAWDAGGACFGASEKALLMRLAPLSRSLRGRRAELSA
jgi:hypothetical protein